MGKRVCEREGHEWGNGQGRRGVQKGRHLRRGKEFKEGGVLDTRRAEGRGFREDANRGKGVVKKAKHFYGGWESERGLGNGMGNATVIISWNVCSVECVVG